MRDYAFNVGRRGTWLAFAPTDPPALRPRGLEKTKVRNPKRRKAI